MIYFKAKYKFEQNNLTNEKWSDYVDGQKGPTEHWQDAWTEGARDRVHNLDLSISEHKDIYNFTLRTHIMFGEVLWEFEGTNSEEFDFIDSDKYKKFQLPIKPIIDNKAYKDNKKLITVGIGFNMDRPKAARAEWEAALGNEETPVSFDDVRNKKKTITDEQAYKLFDYSIKIRENELRRKFGSDWDLLKPNEKITITSMYYNASVLIGPKITSHIKQYIKTQDKKYLEKAFSEVKYQSNPKRDKKTKKEKPIATRKAVQKRMDRESSMLKSYKCSLYSKPGETPIPKNASMQVIPGETVIPRVGRLQINEEELDDYGNKKQYYIWRTKEDDKVRMKHRFFEGKIFHIDNPSSMGYPGKDYNCRCIRDFNIPSFVQQKHYSSEIIRKHITNLFDTPGFCIK